MALYPRLDGRPLLSRGAISGLQEAGGNARWLSSPCPRCIADGSARRTADPRATLGVEAAPGLPGGVCLGRWRAARPAVRRPCDARQLCCDPLGTAGISPATAGLLWSLSVAAEVIVFLITGRPLLDRLG